MKLSDYLSSRDIKPTDFAAALGVPSSTITRWMRGERQPRVGALIKIQEITGGEVTPSDFLPRPDIPQSPLPTTIEADA